MGVVRLVQAGDAVTLEQLAVERDALLTGGRTLETVGTMQAAAGGWLQLRVAVAVREELVRQLVAVRRNSSAWVGVPVSMESVLEMAIDVIGRVDLTPIIESVSPPETRTGASAPRPSGETP